MKKRTKARECAFQMMYGAELAESTVADVIASYWNDGREHEPETVEFADKLFRMAYKTREQDDELITKFLSKNWAFDRVGVVEKCIMRTAISELFNGEAPVFAIMNDYVTLAKKYGDDKTASFVNGILESIRSKFEIERGNDKPKQADKN